MPLEGTYYGMVLSIFLSITCVHNIKLKDIFQNRFIFAHKVYWDIFVAATENQ